MHGMFVRKVLACSVAVCVCVCIMHNIVQINHSQHQNALTQTSIETNHLRVLITHCVFTFFLHFLCFIFFHTLWMLECCMDLHVNSQNEAIKCLCVSSTIITCVCVCVSLLLSLFFLHGAINDLQINHCISRRLQLGDMNSTAESVKNTLLHQVIQLEIAYFNFYSSSLCRVFFSLSHF